MHLVQKVKKNIQCSRLFSRGATIIVGISGGPDSTALTHILHSLHYELGFHLHMAHYNHHLHRNANADQNFVEQLAQQLNIPCSVGHWNNPKTLKKGSLENAARRRRLRFFNQLTKQIHARAVVLAHTKDDLAETILMRILRGTGLGGLRGILQTREIEGLNLVRPLLNTSKDDILSFLKKKNISFRIDPTNKQEKFFRNKIRLELLPLLEKHYNRNIRELLINLADHSTIDYSYLENQTEKLAAKLTTYSKNKKHMHIDLKLFVAQHPALQRMLIRNSVEQLKGDTKRLTLAHFHEIEDLLHNRPKDAIVHLPRNIYIHKDSRHLILTTTNA